MILFVRQPEEQNNHYLQTLKNSGYWDVYCAQDTYQAIYAYKERVIMTTKNSIFKQIADSSAEAIKIGDEYQRRNGWVNSESKKECNENQCRHGAEKQNAEINQLSSDDYRDLLKDYNIAAIDASVIQYYKALQRWTGELLEKIDEYEAEKEETIQDFNVLSLTLSQKYEADPNLTEVENDLMEKRQRFFQQQFSLDMNRVKDKILSIKDQADDLEARLDAVDEKEDSLTGLAELEREARPSFSFIAENTAKVIKEALLKIEYFESHKEQVQQAIAIWQSWTEDYRVFKSTHRQELQHLCQEDDIEEAIWETWYADWQRLRLHIEEKVQPLVAWTLKGSAQDARAEMADALLGQLASYKEAVDNFFLKERKGIYQKYAFVPSGEVQEKFEAENELYKRTQEFQNQVSNLIFSCQNSEDRMLIFKWAFPLWNLSIDEVLRFVADKNLSAISADILRDFAALKSKRYAAFLNDAKAYSQAQKERDNQYNNLIFKMRKNLAPAKGK